MIPDHLVRDLRHVELRTGQRVRNQRVGGFASVRRGDGYDFEQHRPYRPGDDVRRIDWKATARTNTPFLRQTRAERDLQVMIVVDRSRSMEFGSGKRNKHEAMLLASATLLFSALEDRLSVGVVGFSDRVLAFRRPVTDRATAWDALQFMWDLPAQKGSTLLGPVLQHLLDVLTKTSLVLVISDFQTADDLAELPQLTALAGRHDVVAIVLEDPAEAQLPAGSGYVRLRDPESGAEVALGLSSRVRRLFDQQVLRDRLELQQALFHSGVLPLRVDTHGDVAEPIMRLFDGRRA